MSYVRYSAYKESGVPWLGAVPSHWDSKRLSWLFRRKKVTDRADAELLSVYRDHGVVPKDSRDDNFNKASDDLSVYQFVRVGDLVLNKMKTWQGSIAISEFEGIVSPAYFVAEPTSDANLRYVHYLLRSGPYIANYHALSTGIRPNQWDLDYDLFKTIKALLPPPDEQATIAAFLDRETAQIDALIARLEALAALLQEKRQALISHAVTKGLDPSVPMKESGVEWLGEIPAHWEVGQFRRYFDVDLGKMLNASHQTGDESKYPYLRASNIFWGGPNLDDVNEMEFSDAQIERYSLLPGDLLVTEGGVTVGRSCIWDGRLSPVCYQNSINRVRKLPSARLSVEFCYYWLYMAKLDGIVDLVAQQATFGHLTNEKLRAFPILCPPQNEQKLIVEHLGNSLAEMDTVLNCQAEFKRRLQERRAALITAAVTGQIDVRGLAKRL